MAYKQVSLLLHLQSGEMRSIRPVRTSAPLSTTISSPVGNLPHDERLLPIADQ